MWPIGMTPMPGNVFATGVQQVFTLELDGFSSVSKLGHIVSRTTNDCVRLDGEIVKGSE